MGMLTDLSDENIATEEARIKAAYARRCPGGLYSCFDRGHLFLLQTVERHLLKILKAQGFSPLSDKQLLEIGCGEGYWLREFVKWGACPENINGVDLLPDRVARARQLCPEGVRVQCANAAKLAFANDSFDLVLHFTVFSSVLDFNMKEMMAREMLRVVRTGGLVIWYDYHFNNPWNPDVRGIRRREIAQLFPECRIELHRVTLAPPLARLFAPYSWLACCALERFELFNTHYLGVIRRN